MRIVLDSSVLVSDFSLNGQQFRVLREAGARIVSGIFVPEVVVEETVRVQRRELQKALEAFQKAQTRLVKLSGRGSEATAGLVSIQDEEKSLRRRITELCDGSGGGILPYPKIGHSEVVARDLAEKHPFSDNGTGYRDFLIWRSTIELARRGYEPVALLSANTRDFGDDRALHSDLLEDLVIHSLDPNRVHFYGSLKLFNDSVVVPGLEQLEAVSEFLASLRHGLTLNEWTAQELEPILDPGDVLLAHMGVDPEGLSPKIQSIEVMDSAVTELRLLGGGDHLAMVTAKMKIRLAVASSWSDYEHYAHVREFWGPGDEPFSYETGETDAEVEVELSLIVSKDRGRILSREVSAVDGEYQTVASVDDPHPFYSRR
jgi:hypothetical protein